MKKRKIKVIAALIPQTTKKNGCVAIGRYAIFCKSILKAAEFHDALARRDRSKGIPAGGLISIDNESAFYCRYGFLNEGSLFSKS